jgi:RimJ/RimL family protein N-acetyltransferase
VVDVIELEFSPDAVNYVWEVTHAKEMRQALPADYEPYDFVWLMDYWKNGECSMYLPTSGDKPMGICWGEVVGRDDFEGHYSFFKDFWGPPAQEAVGKCLRLVKKQHKVTRFIGTIPVENRRSIAFARRLGFEGDTIIHVDRYGDCLRVTKEI